MGLSQTVGIIFAWFDNLDLQVFTPNGWRTTQVVTHEFQQPHPAGILEYGPAQPGKSSLIIPRLLKKTAQSSSCSNHSGSIPLLHYTGPNKVNPPAMPCSQGVPYLDVCGRNTSLSASQEKDMKWLNTLFINENAMEWHGFNSRSAETDNAPKSSGSTYMFGPLIDAKASHPETVLTSMEYLKKSLSDMRMTYIGWSPAIYGGLPDQVEWRSKIQNCHSQTRNYAHCAVILWLHWKAHAGVWYWKPNNLSIRWAFRNLEWQGLGKSNACLPDGFHYTSEKIPCYWSKDISWFERVPWDLSTTSNWDALGW